MIPTLENIIDECGKLIDMIRIDISQQVYEDLLLLRSLSDLNEHEMIDRAEFIKHYVNRDFDIYTDDSEFRKINKIYQGLNFMTYINAENNNFKIHPFINEEQLKSLLAIKERDNYFSYDSSVTNQQLTSINKTQKKLVKNIDLLYKKSEKEYVQFGVKISYTKLAEHWKYLYNEIQFYSVTNQLICYYALENEYGWAFLNELFYLIELYSNAFRRIKENNFKNRLYVFIQSYLVFLFIDIKVPTVRLRIIRYIVDICEKEQDYHTRIKLIEEQVKQYKYVKNQIYRFQKVLNEKLENVNLSIEKNLLKAKVNYYKDYYYPREKTIHKNIEYNVSLFFEALDKLKK
ncbi:hypothetical protein [Staphylococcus simiae]|uniref:ACP synthase n=1 Tax=Staphylococcus simiae CCM 7213 = CCUG 51256 TaxID=911238 RepID=G5JK78_9STAP|nr:hypothetical protein [Staphylococcus simiae]EHJ07408.1 hypothetical protein SS7213T_09449 [Staphylococcus simiae CCM 7213 = CCUG 51256]PNZ09487.1 ACP synthase [Staphylococcus simiae]SNV54634.1 ORFID:MW0042 [Staphylococcus simiae]